VFKTFRIKLKPNFLIWLIISSFFNYTKFKTLYQQLCQKVKRNGTSESTLKNYARPLAKMAIYFGYDPTNLDFEQVQDYLLCLKESATPSQRYFKHCIYGLRFAFDRLQVHIRNSKYGKSRYVVMSQLLKKGFILTWHLNNYIYTIK